MRSTRLSKKKKLKAVKRFTLWLFIGIIPISAFLLSAAVVYIYKGKTTVETLARAPEPQKQVVVSAAFKNNLDMRPKVFYRLDLQSFDSFEKAQAYVNKIKSKKLNAFIIKENGYKVAFGTFDRAAQAESVKAAIAKQQIQSSLTEMKIPSLQLQFAEGDKNFIEVVRASDNLIHEVLSEKSRLSEEILSKKASDRQKALEELRSVENKLLNYLNYAKDMKVSDNVSLFKTAYIKLLEEFSEHRLEDADKASYYQIQNSLLNQTEALRRFMEKLSV